VAGGKKGGLAKVKKGFAMKRKNAPLHLQVGATAEPCNGESDCSALTLDQAKEFERLWHGSPQSCRDGVTDEVRKQVEAVLGHELSIS
jgi:hypothetical protein